MEIIYCDQRSEEWHNLRRGVITASAAHKFSYANQRKTYLYQLIAERLTGQSAPFAVTDAIQWGIDYEDEARDWYVQETGREVEEVGFVFQDDDRRAGCSPDGLVGEHGLIEIKCPMSKNHVMQIMEGPKLEYRRQMQFQMWCTGRAWCDFVTYDPRCPGPIKGHIKRIPRNEKMIADIANGVAKIIEEVDAFMEEYKLD